VAGTSKNLKPPSSPAESVAKGAQKPPSGPTTQAAPTVATPLQTEAKITTKVDQCTQDTPGEFT
jgi:hypothetical protein